MHHRNSQRTRLRSLIVTAFVSVVGLSFVMPGSFSRWRVASARPTVVYKTYGMDFSPYIDGQDPNHGTEISETQLTARLQIIANYTVWARSFGCTHGLEKFGTVAHSLGLKAAVGAWLGTNTTANSQEIANLISEANAGHVDLAIVGSEVLLRNDLSESQLIAYMNQVRQQIPANIPVATADVYGKLLEHPAVIAASDVVLPNYYPYFEGISISTSIATLHRQHQLVLAAAQGKPVIVSETGWPSAGQVLCNAVPSPANASLYFLNFSSWARANNVSYFYFSALDETWKANYEGSQGSHWGVWDKDGVLKPGMQDVFDGQTMADNWTNAGVPGGPGTPSMEFTYVPPYGSSNNLFGQVFHVNTDDYKVAVYIYVGGWWTKPTFANPLTNVGLDGSWECDITTGGNDPLATQIVAYLVPKTFSPPAMSGGQTLPASLDQNAVAKTEIARSGSSPYIAGQVTNSNNNGLNCVTISLTGSQTATTHTLSNGNYSFLNLAPGGNYTVTPSHPSYTFDPLSLTFNNFSSSQTGNFVALPNYSIALSSSPFAGGTVSGAGTFAAGSSHTVTATANTNYVFTNWTENGSEVSSSPSYTFTLNSNRNLVANFNPVSALITVQTNPAGRPFTVDGTSYSAAQTVSWIPGSSHTISTMSPQSGGTGTQYVWSNWSDGGAISHTVAPSSNTTYTANFATQYLLTMSAGAGGAASPTSGFFSGGQGLQISATANSGFSFAGWTGSGAGSFTGSTNPVTVTMNGPITESASFTQNPIQVTVQTNPAGRTFAVDGTTYSAAQTLTWIPGSSHTISTTSPQSGTTGTQYVWSNWSDGGAISHTVAPGSNTTYTVNFTTQYLLTMSAGTGGTVSPPSGFFNSGQGVQISATANSGFSFAGWAGSGAGSFTGSTNSATVTMNGPISETASFATVPKTVQFSSSTYPMSEGGQVLNINVTRSGDSTAAASVGFATSDGAGLQNCNIFNGVASSRCDYISALGTVNFAAGETSKTISILIVDDSYFEGPETFTIGLNNPFGASLGTQSIVTVTINDNDGINGTNPIDQAGFFVDEHYADFLNRLADPSGRAFWINEITSCGSNQSCIDSKRINVSAAYFLSIEFQGTGYLVERLYKTAYGSANGTSTLGGTHQLFVPIVRFNEFLSDTQAIGQGVVVGQAGWEQALENKKSAFTAEFVQRSRFTTTFPTSTAPAQFVDTLNANAGNPLSTAERNQLVNDLTTNAKTRAQVLRAVAEDADLVNAEFNRAFVLMQFFGYLRRNPNDPQDVDYTGYDFWLGKLNQFGGNFQNAEMVKAFINSIEYRQRFGP